MSKFVRCASLLCSLGKKRKKKREKTFRRYSRRIYGERAVCRFFLSRYTIFQYFAHPCDEKSRESRREQMFNRRIFREESVRSAKVLALIESEDSRDLLREQTPAWLAISQRDIREAASAKRERARHPSRGGWVASVDFERCNNSSGCSDCGTLCMRDVQLESSMLLEARLPSGKIVLLQTSWP